MYTKMQIFSNEYSSTGLQFLLLTKLMEWLVCLYIKEDKLVTEISFFLIQVLNSTDISSSFFPLQAL